LSDTASRRISDTAEDLNEPLIENIRKIVNQIDQATDTAKDVHVITYARQIR
jgi:hypothetical protein